MSNPSARPLYYEGALLPALLEIQRRHGYLDQEALRKYAEKSGVSLHRLQAVGSFFPHFRLALPPKVTLRVCRDMACHMAGSAEMIAKLQSLNLSQVEVKGASCLGRCDRAPAACVAITGMEHDQYYHGRTADELRRIIEACSAGAPPKPHADAEHCPAPVKADGLPAASIINPYEGRPDYAAVRKAVKLRDESLDVLEPQLAIKNRWNPTQLEYFRRAALCQLHVDFPVEKPMLAAVRDWQTEGGWSKGLESAWARETEKKGWSEVLLAEMEIRGAELRGMGGAGIPAAGKWRDVRNAVRMARMRSRDDRAFIVVNGDESEPGTFKDRELLLRTPHLIVEGVILAGLITDATEGFIFIRHEYEEQIEACRAEIRWAEDHGFCGENAFMLGRPFRLSVFVSPGGYICGEQSALIEAMSDHRGEPRNMPPKLETNGLLDLPTLVSNVETFAWAPFFCIRGGAAYAGEGANGHKGRRYFSVSGDVVRPGVYEAPIGMTLRELIEGEAYCQGIAGGRALKAFAPSGPSGGFLPARLSVPEFREGDERAKVWQGLAARRGIDPAAKTLDLLDMELDLDLFRALSPTSALGAGLVVYAEGRDMVEQAVNSTEFYRNESCGKCVPCRLGSQKYASLGEHLMAGAISAERWEKELEPLIAELDRAITLTSICGLGVSVPVPLRTAVRFFREDLRKHLSPGKKKGSV
jgi:NADH:ubiquinone oxidoreductase subunit F (NADH-binding)/NADH:ubiquinone oxidoreductase subunit E